MNRGGRIDPELLARVQAGVRAYRARNERAQRLAARLAALRREAAPFAEELHRHRLNEVWRLLEEERRLLMIRAARKLTPAEADALRAARRSLRAALRRTPEGG